MRISADQFLELVDNIKNIVRKFEEENDVETACFDDWFEYFADQLYEEADEKGYLEGEEDDSDEFELDGEDEEEEET